MLLADTSVWIEHLRRRHADLVLHPEAGTCGTLTNTLAKLLAQAATAFDLA